MSDAFWGINFMVAFVSGALGAFHGYRWAWGIFWISAPIGAAHEQGWI